MDESGCRIGGVKMYCPVTSRRDPGAWCTKDDPHGWAGQERGERQVDLHLGRLSMQ